MTEAAERLKTELARLSAEDRAELAHFLIHSLDEDADRDAEAAWDAELARRGEEIKSGTASGQPAGEALAKLRASYAAAADDSRAVLEERQRAAIHAAALGNAVGRMTENP